ncbi:hypothetical protein E1B28_000290 [Marasmius oreades]|uniref:Uncharacterized protein n=1 Tax=Marasmius oreades TaxID=181124 RepID=A0A9P7V130_9AGAR|nr:uncharacterized protein E1B28_000290 [Marasmius oreades]KAG7098329.1 hypothetical protein E1B28_000290 [Marasmius oreades]
MSSGPSFFEDAHRMNFSGGQSFTNANNIINNYNYPARADLELEPGSSTSRRNDDQWLTWRSGQRLRRIDMCDINVLHEVSSETHRVSVELKSTNPFRNRMRGVVRIRKRIQSAEIVPGFGGQRFSVVSLEPKDDRDIEKIWTLLEQYYEVALSRRRVWLAQLFGVGQSLTPTLIYHDELVDGEAISRQYSEAPIFKSVIDVDADETLRKLPIRFDIVTSAFSEEYKTDDFHWLPLLPDCNPLLDSREIIRVLPNFLQVISYGGDYRDSFHSVHDVLTFGTVIDLRKPGILAYFPSISPPVWSCQSKTLDIVPKYSNSVASLVDLTFVKNNSKSKWKLDVEFSLRLPTEDFHQLQTAFLVQSFPLCKDRATDSEALAFIDELGFQLSGTFTSDPSRCDPPKYLHVPPHSPEWVDNLSCFRWRSNTRLFYWSFDRGGRMTIEEEDWEEYGIPYLEAKPNFGSTWYKKVYEAVHEYLHLTEYDVDGQQFASDHRQPILVIGDPHIQPRSGMVSLVGENMPIERKKGKDKQLKAQELNSQVDVQAGRIGQASVVEISD